MASNANPTAIRIDPSQISAETTVRHVDELTDSERELLLELLDEHASAVPADPPVIGPPLAEVVVKFDDYYYISTAE
ncbi:hypothetical protein [Halosolutus halophilus]|uniref:hypothetical protein n=1 Tax=Halosolutus halophilus TaxID=1552990 RepID=UPI0022351387|nr:hypothetical protein [Halosolutus halophilus]